MDARTAACLVALVVGGGTLSVAGIGTAASGDARAAAAASVAHLRLTPSSPALTTCFPQARASVDVALTTDAKGKDTFRVHAEHLQPDTASTVFLIETPGAPFGNAEHVGDVRTGADGAGQATSRLIGRRRSPSTTRPARAPTWTRWACGSPTRPTTTPAPERAAR